MTCDEVEVFQHALLDGELDAGHARESKPILPAVPAVPANSLPIATCIA